MGNQDQGQNRKEVNGAEPLGIDIVDREAGEGCDGHQPTPNITNGSMEECAFRQDQL